MKPAPLPPLPPEDVRAALVHFAELAAAFEGRGYDLSFSADEADLVLGDQWKGATLRDHKEDEKALREATKCLLTHLRKQRQRQRSGLFQRMLAQLSDAYREYKAGELDPPHLLDRVRRASMSICLDLPDEQLQLLASPGTNALRSGPIEAAKEAMAQRGLMTERTLAKYRSDAHPFDGIRSAFGRFISRFAAGRYAAEVHNSHLTAPVRRLEPWDFTVIDTRPADGDAHVLDHLGEWRVRVLFSDWNIFRSLVPESLGDAIDLRVQEEVDRSLAEIEDAVARRDIAHLAAGPVRAGVVSYIRALDAGANSGELAMLINRIPSAVQKDQRRTVMRERVERFGPLSSPPEWWIDAMFGSPDPDPEPTGCGPV